LWDVRGLRPREVKGPIDVEQAFRDLGDEDPKKAHQAIRRLASDPKRAVPYLAKSLQPAFHEARRSSSQLIEDLGADAFEARQGASAALAKLDEGVGPRLRGSLLAKDVSLELRHRANKLIAQIEASEPTEEQRRSCRAVAALERMNTDAARRLLRRLTAGRGDAQLTLDAGASLGRLARDRP